MDFVRRHGSDEEYIASHERFRGLVLFHRTQAAAALALERRKPEEAIDVVREGVERLAAHQQECGRPRTTRASPRNQRLIEQLQISRAGDPQELRGGKDAPRAARRGRRPSRITNAPPGSATRSAPGPDIEHSARR